CNKIPLALEKVTRISPVWLYTIANSRIGAASLGLNCDDYPFAVHKPAENIPDSFHESVFAVQQRMPSTCLIRLAESSACMDPLAGYAPSHIARGDPNSRIVSHAFYFPRIGQRIDVEGRVLLYEPHRCRDCLTVSAIALD